MLFNSLSFLIFFPIVTFLYFALPQRYRWFLLLLASCVFYMAFIPQYILILFITIVIDYVAARLMESASGRKRKIYLIISVVSTCLVLIIFKYFNFFNANVAAIASFFHLSYPIGFVNIILPIGLSFHTFQSLSYVIEVYYGRQTAERHFGIYSLYVMFYPQLVAGPIERPQHLLHQFRQEFRFEYVRVVEGLTRMLFGFFKKVVIADNLAIYVNQVYGDPSHHSGLALGAASVFFAFQIYCDFSGYSDIAIGSAKVMGFQIMENFKQPYLSTSIAEFWRHWHISLTSWFRDYVYIPLGGNRVGVGRWALNVTATFLLSGLWHGANWTYVIWGVLHGFFMVVGRFIQRFKRAGDWLRPWKRTLVVTGKRLFVFGVVTSAWVFFRSDSFSDALLILRRSAFGTAHAMAEFVRLAASGHIAALVPYARGLLLAPSGLSTISGKAFLFFCMLVVASLGLDIIDRRVGLVRAVRSRPDVLRWAIYLALVIAIMNLGVTREIPFIYFQF